MLFRKEKSYLEEKSSLTSRDKKDILFYAFIGCAIVVLMVTGINTFLLNRKARQEEKDVEKVFNTIYAYMASSTDDEYEKIAKKLRNDMVIKSYDDEMWKYIKLIPNTSTNCYLEDDYFLNQAYILAINTGQLYPIDVFQNDTKPGKKVGNMSMSSGYDEVSETTLQIIAEPDNYKGHVLVRQEKNIVSIQNMKEIYCDKCIKKILESTQDSSVSEMVLFDAKKRMLYPIIGDRKYDIGDYRLSIQIEESEEYKIDIKYKQK